ncbi:MAG: hypothetical protein V2I48_04225 [Xanthomonadales bacterium]|jgi:hypothetical protein|nr:hypothetical protein [Xanthomonadales bacterium]
MRNISVRAFAYATHAVIAFVVWSTILAELFPSFKSLLAGGFGHHWIAKSDLSVIIFIVTALIFARKNDPEDIVPLVRGVLFSAVLGALLIFLFYLGHYLGLV